MKDREIWHVAVQGVAKSWTQLNNWTEMLVVIKSRGFPGDSVVKNLPANAGDEGSIPVSIKSPGEGNGNPLQYSCLGNPMDREAWQPAVHDDHKRVRHDMVTKQQKFILVTHLFSLSPYSV